MAQYRCRYIDAYERVDVQIEATDVAHAAILVLQECGTEPNRPRYRRYRIRENVIDGIARDAEYVVIVGFETASYSLEIKKVGSRKRRAICLHA